MTPTASRAVRLASLASAVLVVAAAGSAPALANSTVRTGDTGGSDGVQVTNTETVQVYFDSASHVETKRVYEQLDLTGHGKVDLRNPISTDGLRNLDGFGGFDVKDGEQLVDTTVDGQSRYRSVSNYDGDLPLKVAVSYKLDGKTVQPGDVVGESGHLEVTFVVENDTATEQQVSFDDGKGGTVTKTLQVPVPIVGTLTTTAPSTFSNVESKAASIAGDGEGGTVLNYTMTLFPPIGGTTSTFGYTADITDGVVPRVEVSALPVDPMASPTFKTAADGYQGGAQTGAQLAAGATKIDSNLLKLRDGAAQLLSGLIKLNNGADALSAGLNDQIAPGAQKLADGAGQLADGTGQLADGAAKAHTGSAQLTDGLRRIDGGLAKLADSHTGMPAAQAGIKKLRDGVGQILAGFGAVGDDSTLIGGLDSLASGLGSAKTGAGFIADGLAQMNASTGLPAAKAGVDQVKAGLDAALAKNGSVDQLIGGLTAAQGFCAPLPTPQLVAQCNGTMAALLKGANDSKSSLTLAAGGLGQVSDGLAQALGGLSLLAPGAQTLAAGLGDAVTGAQKLETGAKAAKAGLQQVDGGLGQLAVGVTKAVAGVMKLSNGAGQAYDGGTQLTDGLSQLDDGAGQLDDGAGQLSTGADQLSDGLGTAADGSKRLADGLNQAADGAPKLVDGAQELSDRGTKKLVEAGVQTTQDYGQLAAVMTAGAERAHTDDMAFGAPEDAIGLTAYSYVIEGEDGEDSRNLTRGLAGLALLAAGAGVFSLRRRLL